MAWEKQVCPVYVTWRSSLTAHLHSLLFPCSYKRSAALSQFVIHRGLIISVMQVGNDLLSRFTIPATFPGSPSQPHSQVYPHSLIPKTHLPSLIPRFTLTASFPSSPSQPHSQDSPSQPHSQVHPHSLIPKFTLTASFPRLTFPASFPGSPSQPHSQVHPHSQNSPTQLSGSCSLESRECELGNDNFFLLAGGILCAVLLCCCGFV